LSSIVVQNMYFVVTFVYICQMKEQVSSVPEFLATKIRALKSRISNDQEELQKLEKLWLVYQKESNKDLSKETFSNRIAKIIKEADKPLLSKQLRKLYNENSNKPEMSPQRFASRMAASSKSKKLFTAIGHDDGYNIWLLSKWIDDEGEILPKYKDIVADLTKDDGYEF
jgi:hypothetical protein